MSRHAASGNPARRDFGLTRAGSGGTLRQLREEMLEGNTARVATRRGLRLVAALLLTAGFSAGARAEPPATRDWEVELLPYAWLPDLDASLETRFGTRQVSVGASDILEDLQLAAMGRVSARWKRWLAIADGLWVRLAQEDGVQRGGISLEADVDLDLALVQALAGFRLYARPGGLLREAVPGDARTFAIDGFAGFDYVTFSADVDIALRGLTPSGIDRRYRLSESWLAPAVGLRLLNDFTPRIRLETLGTLGGFAVGDGPNQLWQLTTLLSYRFTEHWLVSGGHRLFAAQDGRYELRQQGLMLGFGYRF